MEVCLGGRKVHLESLAAEGDSSYHVVGESSLRTGTGLDNVVTELVFVHGDAMMDGVVLPISIEKLGVYTRVVKRQLLKFGGINPAGNVLVSL
jgi:hypothetical protein